MDIHPSQRRVSCEICRKYKSKCQRLQPTDAKCARCSMLGVECTPGLQRKVGRPNRSLPRFASSPHAGDAVDRSSTAKRPRIKSTDRQKNKEARPLSSSLPNSVVASRSPWPSIVVDFFWQLPPATAPWNPTANTSLGGYNQAAGPKAVAHAIAANASDNIVDGIDDFDAMARLSKIDLDLKARLAIIGMNKPLVDLNTFMYRESPLFIDGSTMTQFLLQAPQDYLSILTRLRNSRRLPRSDPRMPHRSHQPHRIYSSAGLPTPLSSIIATVFTRLINTYEVQLECLTSRAERIHIDPVAPIPGVDFGGIRMSGPCEQGLYCSHVIVRLIGKMEATLGIAETPGGGGGTGLLSVGEVEMLWRELEESDGAMRPADVRKLFRKMNGIFLQLMQHL